MTVLRERGHKHKSVLFAHERSTWRARELSLKIGTIGDKMRFADRFKENLFRAIIVLKILLKFRKLNQQAAEAIVFLTHKANLSCGWYSTLSPRFLRTNR